MRVENTTHIGVFFTLWGVWKCGKTKFFEKKTLQTTLKFSDCRWSIRKQIWLSCKKKSFDPVLFLFSFAEAVEHRDSGEFSDCLQMFGQRIASLADNITCKPKIICTAWKVLSTSLALQCYTGYVGSGFVSDDNNRQRFTTHFFVYSLHAQQDCVLPVVWF